MDVIQMNPAELVPYENNTKTHPPEQVDRIAESIRQFGWQQPIVVDRDNVVIIGHGRLMAAKQLMLDTVPVVHADSLTEEQAQALRLADNKTNESPWDFGKLEEELAALSIAGVDMNAFGFDELEQEKASSWGENKTETLCGFEEARTARRCPGGYYLALYKTGEEGTPLKDLKTQEYVAMFADSAQEQIRAALGENLGISGWCILTTPRRRHTDGFHFASEVAKRIAEGLCITYYDDAVKCRNKHRIGVVFDLAITPKEQNVIIYDDIITTGETIRATKEALTKAGKTVFVIVSVDNH